MIHDPKSPSPEDRADSHTFKQLPSPDQAELERVLASLGLSPVGELKLVADLKTHLVIPAITVQSKASSTRYAALLASDGSVVVRLMSKAVRYLLEGWVPTQAQAHHAARQNTRAEDLPLPDRTQNENIPARCTARIARTCRGEEPISAARARQLIRADHAFLDDQGTLQRLCGECSRQSQEAVAEALANLRALSRAATNPKGFKPPFAPPGLQALRDSLPDYTGPGLEYLQAEAEPETAPRPAPSTQVPQRLKGSANWNETAWHGELTPGTAYALGVIAGDGTIREDRIVIELDPEDEDILVAVCRVLDADPSRIYRSSRSAASGMTSVTSVLSLSSPTAPRDALNKLGLKNPGRKDHLIQVPPSLSEDCFRGFLRGFLDTDGTVCQSRGRTPQLQFYSNSLSFLTVLRQRTGQLLGLPAIGFLYEGRLHQWVVSGVEAQTLAQWLWPEDQEWVGGLRKAERATELLVNLQSQRRAKPKRINLT